MIVNMIILILMLSIALMSFIISYQLKSGKWLMWIAGYNDLPKEKREKIDEKALGKHASKTMVATGVFMIIETLIVFILLTNRVGSQVASVSIVIVPILFFISYVVNQTIRGTKYYKKL
ncbi:DUF3784 domain-containing protein [Enterococcus sp. LJL99]